MSNINQIKFAYVKYSTGEKEIVSVDRIKGFNTKNINYDKKYKILWNEDYYDGIVIFVAETEEALEAKINKTRPRNRPMDLYLSASESDTRCKILKESNNMDTDKYKSEKEQLLQKKLRDLSKDKQNATANDNISTEIYKHGKDQLLEEKQKILSKHEQNATINYNINKEMYKHGKENFEKKQKNLSKRQNFDSKEVNRLHKEIEILKRRIAELKLSLQNKDAIAEDFSKANLALQKNVIEEIEELKNIIIKHKGKEKQEQYDETSFPVGYRRETDNNIHIGRNIWISSQVYDSAVCVSKSRVGK